MPRCCESLSTVTRHWTDRRSMQMQKGPATGISFSDGTAATAPHLPAVYSRQLNNCKPAWGAGIYALLHQDNRCCVGRQADNFIMMVMTENKMTLCSLNSGREGSRRITGLLLVTGRFLSSSGQLSKSCAKIVRYTRKIFCLFDWQCEMSAEEAIKPVKTCWLFHNIGSH